jgi:predicted RNA-binding protein with PIN domain
VQLTNPQRSGQRADDLIIQDLRRHHNARELVVVTSDRAIQDVARQHNAKVVDAASFVRQLSRPPQQEEDSFDAPPLPEEEVEEWLAIFGQSDE